ncbi:DUF5753 domain-containing protein [Actinoallomurus spadix]|nr:DUF5753 domain-containing protein [Actinoallomurus spadix]
MQTADYAREVIRSALMPLYPPAEIERRVEVRLARQRVRHRERPLELWNVMDQAVLERSIGSPEIMRAQYEQLIELGELPNVTLQILLRPCTRYSVESRRFADHAQAVGQRKTRLNARTRHR